MDDAAEQEELVGNRIAERVRSLRAERGLSLEALSSASGVSRSMISLIERGETSPTAVVLARLASGLRVSLGALFAETADGALSADGLVVRREAQVCWRDPASGYLRRSVTPPGAEQPMTIAEVHFPPGARVAFDNVAHDVRMYQQIWVLAGAVVVTVGEREHDLGKGDCLAMRLDRPATFHNRTDKSARYAVTVASELAVRR